MAASKILPEKICTNGVYLKLYIRHIDLVAKSQCICFKTCGRFYDIIRSLYIGNK